MPNLCCVLQPSPGLDVLRSVPRFYFNVYNDDVTMDDEGIELPDAHAARDRALEEARNLAAHSVQQGHLVFHHRIEVLHEQRSPVASVRFDEAVQLRP